jgi:endonuclease/exonuclease/phosphatase family metal-dependent hydrolase
MFINPNFILFPAYFGLAYPAILTVNILLAIIALFYSKKISLITFIVIFIGWNLPLKYISINFSEKHYNDGEKIRLLTYNVHNFRPFKEENYKPVYRDSIVAFANSKNFDIAVFQEFFSERPRDSMKNDSLILEMNYPYYYSQKYRTKNNKQSNYDGLIIFSKYPIINKGFLFNEKNEKMAIYADIDINGNINRVYNIHLASIRLGYVFDSTQSKSLFKIGKAFKVRGNEVVKLKNHISNSPYPVIIMGDFNDTPASFAYYQIKKNLNDAFLASNFYIGNTYFWKIPPIRIDHIFVNNNVRVLSYKILPLEYSDHYAVTANVVLK